MATFEFTAPDGKTYEVQGPEGATQAQAFQMLQAQLGTGGAPATRELSATVQAGRAINEITRQLGLTARYGLEGLANSTQIVTEPLRYFTDKLLPERSAGLSGLVTGQAAPPKSLPLGVMASNFADQVGLPKPETPQERVVGDATRLMAGAGGMGGAASLGSRLPNMAGAVMSGLVANPATQIGSAAGAGLAGGASREAGGSTMAQVIASLMGGVPGGAVPAAAGKVADVARAALAPKLTPAQIDSKLQLTLQGSGVDWNTLSTQARDSLRSEAAAALRTGGELDPKMLARLADIRGAGMTPTRSMLTLDPVDATREQNLARVGANSTDPVLQGMARRAGANNTALIARLNDLGAGSGVEPLAAGRAVSGAITGRSAGLRAAEQEAWDAAKSAPGYATQPIYPDALNRINKTLGDEGLMPFMDKGISSYMEAFQTGKQPFTAQAYRNLQSMLARAAKAGGNEGYAAAQAQKVLAGAEVAPITNPRGIDFGLAPVTASTAAQMRGADAAAGNAVDLVNQARGATRRAYAYEDSSPLVRSALGDGRAADPARIAQSFVINGTPDEARMVARELGPQGVGLMREALANHIKQQAVGGASDEVGKVSQAALNRAINGIGREKLGVFFSPEEIKQLESTGRAASYAQVQPAGSAVNNSNTAAMGIARAYDLVRGMANRVPGAGPWLSGAVDIGIAAPIRNGLQGRAAARAQDITPLLLRKIAAARTPAAAPFLLPAAALGGGLLAP